MLSYTDPFVLLSFPSFFPFFLFFSFSGFFVILPLLFWWINVTEMLWLDLDFGLLGRKFSSEHVLVMVVAIFAWNVRRVYYNRAFGCCRSLTSVYCFHFHPSFNSSFLFFSGVFILFSNRCFGGPTLRKCCG